jgi:hypothetical protein
MLIETTIRNYALEIWSPKLNLSLLDIVLEIVHWDCPNDAVRDLTITHLGMRLTASYWWCMVSLGASRGMPDSLYQRL